MTNQIFMSILCLTLFSCSENQIQIEKNEDIVIQSRTDSLVSYFYDNLGAGITLDEVTGELVIETDEDVEFRPYGEEEWIPYPMGVVVKVKCKCLEISTPAGCEGSASVNGTSVTVTCLNPCISGCKMKSKVRHLLTAAWNEFSGGSELRLRL